MSSIVPPALWVYSMVRPNLEYCIQAWAPYNQKDIDTLEKAQRMATKMVKDVQHLSYEDRLKKLNLYNLVRRRRRGDPIEVTVLKPNCCVCYCVVTKLLCLLLRSIQTVLYNSLARVVTHSTTNTTSSLNSLHWLPIRQRIDCDLAHLSTVHSTTLALNTCHLYYILICHCFSFAVPLSTSSANLASTLLLPLVVFDMPSLLFGIPSLIISDLPTLTRFSNPV